MKKIILFIILFTPLIFSQGKVNYYSDGKYIDYENNGFFSAGNFIYNEDINIWGGSIGYVYDGILNLSIDVDKISFKNSDVTGTLWGGSFAIYPMAFFSDYRLRVMIGGGYYRNRFNDLELRSEIFSTRIAVFFVQQISNLFSIYPEIGIRHDMGNYIGNSNYDNFTYIPFSFGIKYNFSESFILSITPQSVFSLNKGEKTSFGCSIGLMVTH